MQIIQTQKRPTQKSLNEPFVVVENVSKIYPTPRGTYTVLQDVNLTVNEGEFVCVIGHSGCGKSTLSCYAAKSNKQNCLYF
jgi:bicarbonate transport system ATP-binding protein